MNKDDILYGLDDYNNEDKVRYISFKMFSSIMFLVLSILFTIPFLMQIVTLVSSFSFENLVNLIIPLLITIGVWKTYKMSLGGKVIDTGGLKLIRGVFTFNLIIIGITTAFLILFIIIGGLSLLFAILPLALVGYIYYIFRQAITTIIASFEDGSSNTDYYSTSITFLIIYAVIILLATFALLTFDFSNIPQLSEQVIDILDFNDLERLSYIIGAGLNVILYLLLAFFIYRLKISIESIKTYYPEFNNIQIDAIDYKISSNILESDREINDRRKYEE